MQEKMQDKKRGVSFFEKKFLTNLYRFGILLEE